MHPVSAATRQPKSKAARSRSKTSAAVRRRPPPNATDGCTGNAREGLTPGHVRGLHRDHHPEGADRHRRSSKINRQSRPWLQSAASIYHASMHLSSYFSGQPPRLRRQAHGFTLIELLTVIAVLAVLTAVVAPSFTPMIQRWNVKSTTESMVSTLYLARTEAIKRGGGVTIKKTPNNTDGCTVASTNEDWGCGWSIFYADSAGNSISIKNIPPPKGIEVTVKSSSGTISLDRWGKMSGINAKGIYILPAGGNLNPPAQGICTSSGGRIQVIGDPPCA